MKNGSDVVVISTDALRSLIHEAVSAAVKAVDINKPAKRGLLSATDVRAAYKIGRDQLREFGDAGRLPFVERRVPGGRMARFYRAEDCDRVLADTHRCF